MGHGKNHDHDHAHGHDHDHAHGHDHDHDHDHAHGHDHDHDERRAPAHGHAHGGRPVPGHGHAHGHSSLGAAPSPRSPFLLGIVLNVCFVALEAVFGVIAHSTALLADAAHNLGDVLGLAMAWGAAVLARRAPSNIHTYGLRRSTVLAALANSVLLLAAVGAVAWEAIGRFQARELAHEPDGQVMIWVAAAGVLVNGISALLFHGASRSDINVRGAFLHLVADAAVSAGVVVAGVLVVRTGAQWVDPATSLLVSLVVLYGTWSLLGEALHLALDGVPREIELREVREFLGKLPEVQAVHDLHVWAMSTTEIALTAHLVLPWPACEPSFFGEVERELRERFGISHVTLQLDGVSGRRCAGCAQELSA
jgi:cobalt-zinc-cadmium efflux system protein